MIDPSILLNVRFAFFVFLAAQTLNLSAFEKIEGKFNIVDNEINFFIENKSDEVIVISDLFLSLKNASIKNGTNSFPVVPSGSLIDADIFAKSVIWIKLIKFDATYPNVASMFRFSEKIKNKELMNYITGDSSKLEKLIFETNLKIAKFNDSRISDFSDTKVIFTYDKNLARSSNNHALPKK